jgi:D-inositol-3-phosphate glycosyltransferase
MRVVRTSRVLSPSRGGACCTTASTPTGSGRERHRLAAGDVAVGVACALRPRKQLEHLFHAASRIGEPHLRVVVAGGPVAGDESYAEGLLATGRQLLGERLLLLGHLKDLREFYNGLDLFVNTSQEEACSISVIEALACGCPILGYPSTSVHEQVLPTGGEIVAQDAIDALSAALGQWIADRERLRTFRETARRRAETVFDIRQLADQLWNEYDSLQSPQARSPSSVR